jgi:hypothetical protein
LTVGALTCGATGQSGGAPDSHCSLSGAPSAPALTSARAVRVVHCSLFTFADDRWRYSRYSAGTPDSPVNYSEVASQIPKGEKFGVDLPSAPDTVRWYTGQSGAPDQGSLRLSFALFI